MSNDLQNPIRVGVVDDSAVVRQMLSTRINADPSLRVIATGKNGREAIELVAKHRPNLITMDAYMPVMDGFEATKQIMAHYPTPILIVSSTLYHAGGDLAFKALQYGALDVMDKTPLYDLREGSPGGPDLIRRIKSLSRVKVITHPLGKLEVREPVRGRIAAPSGASSDHIVAIASSTGGPQALLTILRTLPKSFPCGILIVQHISEGFDVGLAQWLDDECEITVRLASGGMPIEPGISYVAPTAFHMCVMDGPRIRLTNEEPVDGQKPSGTVLFESVARMYGDRAVAVILTGMGRDGAQGLKQIKAAGGCVIAQDEASCVVFGMPKAAIELGVVDWVQPVDRISTAIAKALGQVPQLEDAR